MNTMCHCSKARAGLQHGVLRGPTEENENKDVSNCPATSTGIQIEVLKSIRLNVAIAKGRNTISHSMMLLNSPKFFDI